jgi:tRNA(Ile)-lysidine synthase TilS/MesJ
MERLKSDLNDLKAEGIIPKSEKTVVYCKKGEISLEAAELLCEKGVDAYSLQGGYMAWLIADMEGRSESEDEDFCDEVEKSIRKRFKKRIWSKFTRAINEYELVKPGDKIAVCISGGKDSMLMAKLFQELKRHNKFDFDVKFLVMDPGYSPENRQVIENNAKRLNIPITVFESDIFESVFNVEKSPCYLCARMRRGHLYSKAKELGCNKIALGHHYDDVIETILMGMLYGAQMQTMMPKLHSTNFEGMELIRPLYLVREDDIKAWRDANNLTFIQCACKFTDTCSSCQDDGQSNSKRLEVKKLIQELKKTNPFVEGNIFKSVENVNLSTVIAYKKDGVKHHFLDEY